MIVNQRTISSKRDCGGRRTIVKLLVDIGSSDCSRAACAAGPRKVGKGRDSLPAEAYS
ncbi:hypothetical protein GCM10028796_58310 [Ramlibacter monticola]